MATRLQPAPAEVRALPAAQAAKASLGGWALGLVALLLLFLQAGPLIGLLGFNLTGDGQWTLTGAMRDGLVLLLVALAGTAWLSGDTPRPLPRSAHVALATVAGYALCALLADTHPIVLALNFRRIALVPVLFVVMLMLPWTPRQVDRLFGWIVASTAAVAVLGLAERLGPVELWSTWLKVGDFAAASGFDPYGRIPFEQSGRYFSWDLGDLVDGPVRRMISSYLDPTLLATSMSALLVFALARQARGNAATGLIALALACGLLTLSKGFVLFALLLLVWRVTGFPAVTNLAPLALAILVATYAIGQAFELVGPLTHLRGTVEIIDLLRDGQWLGVGLGNAGNYTLTGNESGAESGIGNTVSQLGLVGLAPLLWVHALGRDMTATATLRRDPGGIWLAHWLTFWLSNFLLSVTSLGVSGNALGFMALALYLHPSSGRTPRQ